MKIKNLTSKRLQFCSLLVSYTNIFHLRVGVNLFCNQLLLTCLMALMCACSQSEGDLTAKLEAAGVKHVVFGTAQRVEDGSGGQICKIPEPLPQPPTFNAGVTEISYIVELDPNTNRELEIVVTGPFRHAAIRGTNCNAYSVIGGAPRQTQLGSTLSRQDGRAFKSGSYILEIKYKSETVKIPFSIK